MVNLKTLIGVYYNREYNMDKKRARFAQKPSANETPGLEAPEGSRQQLIEKNFLQMSNGKTVLEVYKVRMLLKSISSVLTPHFRLGCPVDS